jgi:hypothetical protein
VYVGIVSYLSSWFPAQNDFVSPLIATGIVAGAAHADPLMSKLSFVARIQGSPMVL